MIAMDLLSIEEIRRRLTASTVGNHIYLYGTVDSTNAKLRRLARSGALPGTVVLAEAQTAGRGRNGAAWFSPSGLNLYASVLFRPAVPLRELGVFTFVASLALADAVKDHGATPAIKWPNDVLVGGRKVAGTLVEAAVRKGVADHVIVGVGVNLNVEPTALRSALAAAGDFATSLAAERGKEIDRNVFAAAYLSHLDRWAGVWAAKGASEILAEWRARDILTGRRVEIRGSDTAYQGRVAGVDVSGSLVVIDPLGVRHVVTSEDVRILD